MINDESIVEVPKSTKSGGAFSTLIGKSTLVPRLIVTSGPRKGSVLRLNVGELTIGRDPQSGLYLVDNAISRKQCTIKADRGTWLISDCSSLNGSFVNGLAIREKVLQHGDRIRLGSTELVFMEDDEEASARASRAQDDLTKCIPYRLIGDSPLQSQAAYIPARLPQVEVSPAISQEVSPVEGAGLLAHFAKILNKQRWKLLACIAVAVAAALAIQFFAPKSYEATALVKIDRHNVGGVVGEEATQASSVGDMDQIITTQIELVQSDPVLRPVAERFHLVATTGSKRNAEIPGKTGAAPLLLKGLTISRPQNTYLIRISYRAHDPQLAADVANAVAQSMTEHANDTEKNSHEQISALVAQDMSALRTKMEVSGKQLAQFEKQLNMVDPTQRATILTARLSQLNTEYTTAQEERLRRQAILAQLDGATSLASAQTAQAAAQDPLLNEAIQRLNTARQQFALARSYYGEAHPEFRKAQKQVEEVQSQVEELKARAKDRAEAEYRQARDRENLLRGVVQQAKAEGNSLLAVAHQYEQLRSEAENDKKVYEDLATRARIAGINEQFRNATIQIVARALVPQLQIFPKLLINVPLALIISAILGILVAVFADALNTTFSDSEEIASKLRVDVVAAIPTAKLSAKLGRNQAADAGSKRAPNSLSYYEEAIRTVRTAVTLAAGNRPIRSVLLTSAVPGEGKSTTAAHLALAYAQLGRRVLLVDANFRRPGVHKMFGEESTKGAADVLQGKRLDGDVIHKSEHPGLFVMPAGPLPRRATDLISIGFCKIVDKLRREFDLIIVDGPHALGASETQELADAVDSVVLVTKANATNAKLVANALSMLRKTRANLIGVVVNQVKASAMAGYSQGNFVVEHAKSIPSLGA